MIGTALWLMLALETTGAPETLRLIAGRGAVIDCPGGVARVSTSNPDAVDAVVASDAEVLFQGKAPGQATLVLWSKSGLRKTYEVTVEPNLDPLRELLKERFPGESIEVRATRDAAALVGRVSSPEVAAQALALASAAVKGSVSALEVPPAGPERQIVLKVRFAEVNRSVTSDLGLSLFSTGGTMPGAVSTGQFPAARLEGLAGPVFSLSDILNIFAFRRDLNVGAIIRDLQSRGLLEVLAEPNLVATNGKEASFLAGGEFPVPILQSGASAGAVTVMFREFGIRLAFLPQVTAHGTIKLHVKPEVSTIDPAGGVTVSGFRIPALSTRRVETDIELAEGQSFVIGGLLDERTTETMSRMPGLANIPVLGVLFRSRSKTKSKTELMVLVTPEWASPKKEAK